MSKIGASIIFDSITLTMITNGIANKNVVPKAINFLVFPIRLKVAAIIHKKTIEVTATTVPTENTSFAFIRLPNKNK